MKIALKYPHPTLRQIRDIICLSAIKRLLVSFLFFLIMTENQEEESQ